MKNIFVIFLILSILVSCQKNTDIVVQQNLFLSSKPGDKGFERSLKYIAESLYKEKWGGHYKFDKPTIRKEKMLVEWENQETGRVTRKNSRLRYSNLPEKLSLMILLSHLGPVNPEKLMKSGDFLEYKSTLGVYLSEAEDVDQYLLRLKELHSSILKSYMVKPETAKKNEVKFNVGLLYATGFYLGLPFYKRITLDDQIYSRYSILKVYLHECGHQLFDKNRKLSKSIKLGLSWIGWRKSASSWWSIEEKSCNLFADELLDKDSLFLQRLTLEQKQKLAEIIKEDDYKPFKRSEKLIDRFAVLFYDSAKAQEKLMNKRINERYDTASTIGKMLKSHLNQKGVLAYIKSINKCFSSDEVLQVLKVEADLKSKKD